MTETIDYRSPQRSNTDEDDGISGATVGTNNQPYTRGSQERASSSRGGPSSPQKHGHGDSIDLDLERGLKLDDLRLPGQQPGGGGGGSGNGVNRSGSQHSHRSSIHSDASTAWDPTHPCYPHVNPHVPADSPLAQSTRIIRIPRDFMVYGETAPAFSNIYPNILEPYLEEDRFRAIIRRLNDDLKAAFDPWNWRNWLDAGIGLLTLWFAEDIFGTEVKRRLKKIETFLEAQNHELEDRERSESERDRDRAVSRQSHAHSEKDVSIMAARLIPLRRTGYMNVRI